MRDFLDLVGEQEREATLSDPHYRMALGLDRFDEASAFADRPMGRQQQRQPQGFRLGN